MNAAKGFLIAIIGLFGVITLMSLLMPSKVMMARSVVIRDSAANVFSHIRDLNEWKKWHPLFMQEGVTVHVHSPSSGEGAKATWNSNGRDNILSIMSDTAYTLQASLERVHEKPVMNYIQVSQMQNSAEVNVEWKTVTSLKWYPWEKFSGIFIDKMSGPGYEQALQSLKEYCEQ